MQGEFGAYREEFLQQVPLLPLRQVPLPLQSAWSQKEEPRYLKMRMGGSNGGSDSCPDRHSGDRKDGICDSLNNKQHTYLRGRSGIRCFDSLIWLFGYGYGFDFNLCKIWSRLNHDAGVICDSLNLLADQVPQRL